jgi:hypothetical protein
MACLVPEAEGLNKEEIAAAICMAHGKIFDL